MVSLAPVLLSLGCVNLNKPAVVSACAGSSTQPCKDPTGGEKFDAPVVPDAPVLPSPDVSPANNDARLIPQDGGPGLNSDSPTTSDDVSQNGDTNSLGDSAVVPDGKILPDVGADVRSGLPDAGIEVQSDAQADVQVVLPPELGAEFAPEPGPEPAGVEPGLEPGPEAHPEVGPEPSPEPGPEPRPEPGPDAGAGDVAINCIQQIINNGYSFGTTPPCSACVENGTSRATQCTAIIDCLQTNYPCTGNCTNQCNNTAKASGVAISCANAITTAAACPPP